MVAIREGASTQSDALVFFGATGDLALKARARESVIQRLLTNSLACCATCEAGKCLPVTCTEIVVRLRQPPTIFQHYDLKSNCVRMRVVPEVVLAFGLNVTSPVEDSRIEIVEMLASRHRYHDEADAYERLLTDAMAGDATLFAREDYVEEAWHIVDPALKAGTPVYEYEPKTWGPAEVKSVTPISGWSDPVVTS
jgi:glucose-6-phosphate 1-dehydrogenase